MNEIFIYRILVAFLVAAVILLWNKFKNKNNEIGNLSKTLRKERRQHESLKGKYQVLKEEQREMELEVLINSKDKEIMKHSDSKIKVSDLSDLLTLRVELEYPHDFLERKKEAQKLFRARIRKLSSTTRNRKSLFPMLLVKEFGEMYVTVSPTKYDKEVITPILDDIKKNNSKRLLIDLKKDLPFEP